MRVVAIPNPHFPPDDESLALADVVVASIDELTVEVVAGLEVERLAVVGDERRRRSPGRRRAVRGSG